MLTTRAIQFDTPNSYDKIRVKFEVLLEGQKNAFLSFEYPFMSRKGLQKLIGGEDFEDQNEDGVFVSMKNKILHIMMYRGNDGLEEIHLDLPHEVCRPAFEQMVPIYERIAEACDVPPSEEYDSCDDNNIVDCEEEEASEEEDVNLNMLMKTPARKQ